MFFKMPAKIDIRKYAAIELETGQWVSGDDYKIYRGNESVWLWRLKNTKRRTIEKEYLVLPCSLSICADRNEDGIYIFSTVDLSRWHDLKYIENYEQQKKEWEALLKSTSLVVDAVDDAF